MNCLNKKYEKNYNEYKVVGFLKRPTKEDQMIIAKSFISEYLTNKLPKNEYVKLIIEGAKEKDLPKEYINKIVSQTRLNG